MEESSQAHTPSINQRWTALRIAIVTILGLIAAPALCVAVLAAGASLIMAIPITLLVCTGIAAWLTPKLPAALSQNGSSILLVLWIALGLFAAYRVASLSVFMSDVTRTDYAFAPTVRTMDDPALSKPFFPKHNCFTCYIVAAHLATEGAENLYDKKYYRNPEIETPIHQQIGEHLSVDTYQYPPPFLLLPRLLLTTGGDFMQLRAYWFPLSVVAILTAMLAMLLWTRSPGDGFGMRWLAIPILFITPTVLGSLQMENVHPIIVSICLLSLPMFGWGRHRIGGALLGFAVVSKLFPGLLLIFLLLQRRWRAFFWTCGWMVIFCGLTVVMLGTQPFTAFLDYQLPRLASGEAFGFATTHLGAMMKNGSIFGICYKLEHLGIIEDASAIAKTLVWIYSGLLMVVMLIVGLRQYPWSGDTGSSTGERPWQLMLVRVWLMLLVLAQLRSPFLPWAYGNIPVLLFLATLYPRAGVSRNRMTQGLFVGLLAISWAKFAVIVPLPLGQPDPTPDMIYTLIALAVTLTCCVIVFLKKPGNVRYSANPR